MLDFGVLGLASGHWSTFVLLGCVSGVVSLVGRFARVCVLARVGFVDLPLRGVILFFHIVFRGFPCGIFPCLSFCGVPLRVCSDFITRAVRARFMLFSGVRPAKAPPDDATSAVFPDYATERGIRLWRGLFVQSVFMGFLPGNHGAVRFAQSGIRI